MAFSAPALAPVRGGDRRPARPARGGGPRPRERDGERGVHRRAARPRAGLSLKAFYTCFRSKDDLLLALLADDSRIGAAFLRELIAGRPDPAARVRLRALRHGAPAGSPATRACSCASTGGWSSIGRTSCAPRSRRSSTSSPRTSTATIRTRDARTMFGVLLDGIHDVVVGRVDDVGELAAYLYGFCAEGWQGR